jgi:hypothetical protein
MRALWEIAKLDVEAESPTFSGFDREGSVERNTGKG